MRGRFARRGTPFLVLALGAVALALIAACETGGDGGGNGATTVTMAGDCGEFCFTPDSFTAAAGQQVEVTLPNEGTVGHSFVIDELNVNSGVQQPGAETTVTFTPQAGTYTFYCDVPGHREAGMEGTLTVS